MIRRSEGGRLLLVITVLCADVGAYILSPSSFAQDVGIPEHFEHRFRRSSPRRSAHRGVDAGAGGGAGSAYGSRRAGVRCRGMIGVKALRGGNVDRQIGYRLAATWAPGLDESWPYCVRVDFDFRCEKSHLDDAVGVCWRGGKAPRSAGSGPGKCRRVTFQVLKSCSSSGKSAAKREKCISNLGDTESSSASKDSESTSTSTSKSVQSENGAPVMWSKPVKSRVGDDAGSRFWVMLAGKSDLDEAGALCVKVFFGEPENPWKAVQLRQLTSEQRQDLESRCQKQESIMFKAVDTWNDGAIVGFVEVSSFTGAKYGMGIGVPLAEKRPLVTNLAVDPRARRCGIGSALMDACEDIVKTWDLDEIILQVEEDNLGALAFYEGLGFQSLYVDRAARRYDTSGFFLKNVRTSKVTMRKTLHQGSSAGTKSTGPSGNQFQQLLELFLKPFATRNAPSHPSSMEGLSWAGVFGGAASGGSTTPAGDSSGPLPFMRLQRTRQ